jgi:NAD(P)-dependent dehydrogenase (short-subunit alcohol dehydrogenase family)
MVLMKPSGRVDLMGQSAIVTGAARGIGQAISLALAREGADIVAFDIMEPVETASRIRSFGRRALSIVGNVAEPDDVKRLVNTSLKECRQIQILVNNAGIALFQSFLETGIDDWRRVIDVNLTGAFLCTQAILEHMIQNAYGKIVFIGSVTGEVGSLGVSPAYAVSKGGVHALAKTVAKIGAPHGICANAVAPNVIRTKMTQGVQFPQTMFPLGRMGEPEDVAEAVVFLASPASNYVTGQILFVDGGFSVRT